MTIRTRAKKGEFLATMISGRSLGLSCAVIGLALFMMGSLARPAVPASLAMGSVDVAVLDEAIDSAEENVSDRGLYYSAYVVVKGDTVGGIAEAFGVTTDSIVSFNDIKNTRTIRPGQVLKVPSSAGILYTAKEGDSVETVAAKYEISPESIIETNGLLDANFPAGAVVFLPDARIPSFMLREINGDLFRWPIRGWVTSRYGWRTDPFSGARTFHNALDIGSSIGVPILAAMEGRVSDTGYSPISGNYVRIAHHSGWVSFYGHLNSIAVRPGEAVRSGERIGAVGNTGYSTGPHLHFSVFKNGRSVNPSIVMR